MDLVVIPNALFLFYGALVLSCGTGIGIVIGRNPRTRSPSVDPTDDLIRRVSILETELGVAQSELTELGSENAFLKELVAPRVPAEDRERQIRKSAA